MAAGLPAQRRDGRSGGYTPGGAGRSTSRAACLSTRHGAKTALTGRCPCSITRGAARLVGRVTSRGPRMTSRFAWLPILLLAGCALPGCALLCKKDGCDTRDYALPAEPRAVGTTGALEEGAA